jgi:hypothetical protein
MRLARLVVAEEPATRPAHGREPGTAVPPEYPRLPQPVEALDIGVAAQLPRRDEPPVHPEEQPQAQDLGEGEAVGVAPGQGELVVHLADPRHAELVPGVQEVGAEGLGPLGAAVAGGHRPADQVQGVEGEEARKPPGAADMPGADEVGLLDIADPRRSRRRTGPAPPPAASALPAGTALLLQEPLDRPEAGEPAHPPLLQFPADGLGPRPAKAVRRVRWATNSARTRKTSATTRAGVRRQIRCGVRARSWSPAPASRRYRAHPLATQARHRRTTRDTAVSDSPRRSRSMALHRRAYSLSSSTASPPRVKFRGVYPGSSWSTMLWRNFTLRSAPRNPVRMTVVFAAQRQC